MRSQKYQANDARRFLSPTVNRYKLHLATVKAQGLDKLVKRTPELNLPKDATIEINGDSPKIIQQRPGDGWQNVNRTLNPTVLAFVNGVTGTCRTVLPPATAVPSGLKGDMGQQVHRGKPQRATHSAGATYSNSSSSALWPKGEPVTLTDKSAPGFPIAFRSRDDCACSPERLDLDRHGLEECPQLGGLHRLRLLNLQHNLITNIQNLSHLRFLVFLDLYDNHLSEMTGIAALRSLRVLMLGKNRIETISCLHNLTKLDVLDLHGNQISQIQNVSHLSELRVLNLAGNCISGVENLEGLDSLTELNLRRNSISSVTEVDRLPCLQRLFLSCNSITSFDDLACLRESFSLSELTLDGNPVALETWYKQTALRCVLQLRQLDMKRVTEEERRMASAQVRKEDEKKRDCHKQVAHKSPALMMPQPHLTSTGIKSQDSSGTSKAGGVSLSEGLNYRKERDSHFEKRRLAIRNAAQQWEGLRSCLELPSQNGTKEEVSPEISPAHSPAQTNGLAQEPSPDEPRRVSPVSGPERPTGGGENRLRAASRPNSPRDPRLLEAGGSSVQSLSLSDCHLAELDGDTLRLFGSGALEALERGWGVQTAGAVTVITFRYIHFDSIVPTLPRIRVKFPNLSHLMFLETNISRLPQLAALAQVRRLDQLTIHPECNPVVSLALWRAFVLYRLHHFNLQKVNGQEVTMEELIGAERLFGTLGHIAATETPSCRLLVQLEESRKRQLQFLLEGRGRRAGLSPEELRDNSRLLGEGLNRALFNYPSRDCSAESPEDSAVETLERGAMTEQYLQELVQRASDTNLKGESLHKLWPCMFVEMVRDCVLEMRDQPAFRRACLSRLSQTK